MAGKSDYLENAILDHILSGTTYTPAATVYIALFTVAPVDAGTGGTEVTGGSYARASVTNNLTNWPTATGGTKTNGTTITFTTATGTWGTIVAFGIYDALTVGNLLYFGSLSTAQTVVNGNTVSFAASSLTITED